MDLKKEITFSDVKRVFARKKSASAPKRNRRAKREEHKVKELVGLEIGASKLAAAHVSNNGKAELRKVASEPIETGIVVNGELKDVNALAGALKGFFDKHGLPKKGVRLGVANSRIGVRPFEITGVTDENQLENAIRFRAQELLPIPLEDAVIDHHVLEERTDENGATTWRVLLVVAHRALIDGYVSACQQAGIELAGIDLEAFGLLRALGAPGTKTDEKPDAALVVVSLGHERSTLAVSDGRVCEFARVLEWGGATLTSSIAKALSVTADEAEGLKRRLALGTEAADAETPESRAARVVQRDLQSFARELVSSLQFYQAQPGSLPIAEIVITGGTSDMSGLAGELEGLIRVGVRVGDPTQRVGMAPSVNQLESLASAAVAIGLGIED